MRKTFSLLLSGFASIAILCGIDPINLNESESNASELYASGNFGRSTLLQQDVTLSVTGATASGEVTLDADIAFTGAIGTYFDQLRVEGELSRINSDFELINVESVTALGVTISGNLGTSLAGSYDTTNAMVNFWYDINDSATVGSDSRITPFLGGGIGFSRVAIDVDSIGGEAVTYDENETVYAYQVGAGIGYELADTTSLNFSYRYFATDDVEFDDGSLTTELEYSTHLFLIGLSQRF